MKLMVTGAAGQVGRELVRQLPPLGEVIALNRADCELTDPASLRSVVHEIRPDVILNAAAYTAVDRAEQEEDLATTINGVAPGVLAEAARNIGALLIHYSTDYVFDGCKPAPYTEDDPPCPINVYGKSKLAGESAIRKTGCDHLILRTSWVYAARGQNFLRTILRLAGERPELKVVGDQQGAPTWARHIADGTLNLVREAQQRRIRRQFSSCTYNLTAAGSVSWHGFAQAIIIAASQRGLLDIKGLPKLVAIPTENYPTPAARPRNSRLDGARLNQHYQIELPSWQDGMAFCIEELVQIEALHKR